ncbi:hypothetical protein KR215_000075 [Drosophila sulfurigaster]|nr:hypothetical protein KR215_000075 [Drosophila sulfurigaster]
MEPHKKLRTTSKAKYDTIIDSKAQQYLNALKVRWMQLHEMPGLFAYQLREERLKRQLPGRYGFHVELNADRSLKRRAPQIIDNLNPKFKPQQFNFNKVDGQEVLLIIDDLKDKCEIQMIINKSPLTKYHTLICPDVKKNLVQRVTLKSLAFCINFLRNIEEPNMRMGYNSPGALASVNHLHFHLLDMPQELYIDKVNLQEIAGGYAYRLNKESPTEAVCFVVQAKDDEQQVLEKVQNIHKLTEWLCNNKLPHNMFITQQKNSNDLRVFVFVRDKFCVSKDVTAFNVGFCELAGFIPLSDEDKVNNLTEQKVIERIRSVTGNAYDAVYDQVQHIVNGTDQSLWQQPFTL